MWHVWHSQEEKIFIMDLLELLPLPLETYVPYIRDRIQNLWIVYS